MRQGPLCFYPSVDTLMGHKNAAFFKQIAAFLYVKWEKDYGLVVE